MLGDLSEAVSRDVHRYVRCANRHGAVANRVGFGPGSSFPLGRDLASAENAGNAGSSSVFTRIGRGRRSSVWNPSIGPEYSCRRWQGFYLEPEDDHLDRGLAGGFAASDSGVRLCCLLEGAVWAIAKRR